MACAYILRTEPILFQYRHQPTSVMKFSMEFPKIVVFMCKKTHRRGEFSLSSGPLMFPFLICESVELRKEVSVSDTNEFLLFEMLLKRILLVLRMNGYAELPTPLPVTRLVYGFRNHHNFTICHEKQQRESYQQ